MILTDGQTLARGEYLLVSRRDDAEVASVCSDDRSLRLDYLFRNRIALAGKILDLRPVDRIDWLVVPADCAGDCGLRRDSYCQTAATNHSHCCRLASLFAGANGR